MIVNVVMISLSVAILCCASTGGLSADLSNAMLRQMPESHVAVARRARALQPAVADTAFPDAGLAAALAVFAVHDEFRPVADAVTEATARLSGLADMKVLP